eukprot:scaffold2051_cov389-Prasinococcus_capsulatus_cf.AAC.10
MASLLHHGMHKTRIYRLVRLVPILVGRPRSQDATSLAWGCTESKQKGLGFLSGGVRPVRRLHSFPIGHLSRVSVARRPAHVSARTRPINQ